MIDVVTYEMYPNVPRMKHQLFNIKTSMFLQQLQQLCDFYKTRVGVL